MSVQSMYQPAGSPMNDKPIAVIQRCSIVYFELTKTTKPSPSDVMEAIDRAKTILEQAKLLVIEAEARRQQMVDSLMPPQPAPQAA